MRNLHTVSNLLLNMKLLYTTPDGTTYNCHVLDDINFHWPCLRGGFLQPHHIQMVALTFNRLYLWFYLVLG